MALSGDLAIRPRPGTPPNRILIPTHPLSPNISAAQEDHNDFLHSFKQGHQSFDFFSPVNQNGSFEFDRVLKNGKVHRRVKKKGAWKPSWKSAQLVLRPNLLSVYKDEDATELLASINLTDVTAVAPVKKVHTQHVFGVFSPSKNYQFQGASEQDTKDWIERIRKEAPMDADEAFFLASPENKPEKKPEQHLAYENSDFSDAFDDRASSPEPGYSAKRARKGRSRASTAQRIPSQIHEYSGNEMMTSYSDFSDTGAAVSSSIPRSILGTSPSGTSPPMLASTKTSTSTTNTSSRQTPLRNISQLSISDPMHPNNPHNASSVTQDPSRVIRQGYLLTLRRSSGVKSWKRLWVVLRPNSLSFYKSEAEYALVKLVDMSVVINAAEIDPVSRSKNFCFQIILEDKTYRFACHDEEDIDAWLGSLKSVLVRIKRERANSTDMGPGSGDQKAT